jgi:hypothetical protein
MIMTARELGNTPLRILTTYKRTTHLDEDSHAQHGSITTPEVKTHVVVHGYTEPPPHRPGQTRGGHVAPQSIDREQQERKCRHAGDAGNMTNGDPNIASKLASYLGGDNEASTTWG